MANINVRKENGNIETAPKVVPPQWEPFRLMRSLMGLDPFQEMTPFLTETTAFSPAFDIKETKDAFVFKADVPGVKESDIEVTTTGNRLTVTGKREAEHKEQSETFYAYERSYGSFSRTFTLPDGADTNGAIAELKNGVLALTVPKKPELQPKKIAVKAGAAPKS